MAERELLNNVKFTETFDSLDTITVTTDLVKNPDKFFELGRKIAGCNFCKVPHETKREDD